VDLFCRLGETENPEGVPTSTQQTECPSACKPENNAKQDEEQQGEGVVVDDDEAPDETT